MKVKAFFGKLWSQTKKVAKKAFELVNLHKGVSIAAAATALAGTACAIVLPIALHKHEYASEWSFDAESHWHEAVCKHADERGALEAHAYDNDCDITCNVCGAERQVGDHVYDNACDTTCNECGAERQVGDHVYGNACDTTCNECGAERSVTHTYADTLTKGDSSHWYECTVCADKNNERPHAYDNDCDTTCNECGAVRQVGAHVYDNDCDTICNECGAERQVGDHVYDNDCDTTCNECGAVRQVGDHVYDNACDTSCNECGATREIQHDYSDALTHNDGTHWYACKVCGGKKDETAHTFDREVAHPDYLKAAEVPGVSLAVYYKSCECGQRGGEDDVFTTDKKIASIKDVVIEDKVYDGTPVTQPAYVAVTNGVLSIEYKLKNADDSEYTLQPPSDVGEYMVRITAQETATYAAVTAYAEFSITKRSANVTVIDIPDSVVYTGEEVKINGFTADVTEGAVIEYTVRGRDEYTTQAPTSVGEYTVRVTVTGSENWDGGCLTKDFEITKKQVSATITANDITYGEELNVVAEAEIELIVEYSADGGVTYSSEKPRNAGVYLVRIAPKDSENYELTGVTEKSFTINKAQVSVTITFNGITDGEVDYGASFTVTVATANYSGQKTVKYVDENGVEHDTNETKMPIGDYTVVVTLANENYEITSGGTEKFTISPAPITDLELTAVYNATTEYEIDLADKGYESLGIKLTVDTKNAGEKTVLSAMLSGDNAGNYTIEIPEISFEIKKATLNVTWVAPEDLSYTNEPKVPTASFSGKLSQDEVELAIALKSGDNVTEGATFTYAATLSGIDAKNYEMDVAEKTYTVDECKHYTVDDYGFCTVGDCHDYTGGESIFGENVSAEVKPGEKLYWRIGKVNEDNVTWDLYYYMIVDSQSGEFAYTAYREVEGNSFEEFNLEDALETGDLVQYSYIYLVITVETETKVIFSIQEGIW